MKDRPDNFYFISGILLKPTVSMFFIVWLNQIVIVRIGIAKK